MQGRRPRPPPHENTDADPYSNRAHAAHSHRCADGDAGAGDNRTLTVTPGHRYQLEAWARYTPTSSGLHLALGVDLVGGGDVTSSAVQWYPWRDDAQDRWLATQETVTASGDRLTIFLRAIHPAAVEGGNTMFDNVSFADLGP